MSFVTKVWSPGVGLSPCEEIIVLWAGQRELLEVCFLVLAAYSNCSRCSTRANSPLYQVLSVLLFLFAHPWAQPLNPSPHLRTRAASVLSMQTCVGEFLMCVSTFPPKNPEAFLWCHDGGRSHRVFWSNFVLVPATRTSTEAPSCRLSARARRGIPSGRGRWTRHRGWRQSRCLKNRSWTCPRTTASTARTASTGPGTGGGGEDVKLLSRRQ